MDRYHQHPPKFCGSAADNSILGCNIMYQLGEKPIPFKARSYNGHYLGLSIRRREFDSPTHRQVYSAVAQLVE